jgi:hypothetical protein
MGICCPQCYTRLTQPSSLRELVTSLQLANNSAASTLRWGKVPQRADTAQRAGPWQSHCTKTALSTIISPQCSARQALPSVTCMQPQVRLHMHEQHMLSNIQPLRPIFKCGPSWLQLHNLNGSFSGPQHSTNGSPYQVLLL